MQEPDWKLYDSVESEVKGKLGDLGWTLTRFGRLTFTDEFNTALDRLPIGTPLRFMPDYMAIRDGVVLAVEVKGVTGGRASSPNYAMPEPCLLNLYRFTVALGIDGIVVWHDGRVSWADDLARAARGLKARGPVDGKRTAYFLFPKDTTRTIGLDEL